MSSLNRVNREPRHILQLSLEEKRNFFNSFDHIFSDIDGVIWNFIHPIPNTGDAITALVELGKTVSYITNNSVRPMESYKKKFQAIGVKLNLDSIWHPVKSIVTYLKNIQFNESIFVIGSEHFKKFLSEAGFTIIDGPNKIFEENFSNFAKELMSDTNVGAVIIDFDFNVSAPKLTKAQLCLNRSECLLIIGATDLSLPLGHGVQFLGPGHFSAIVAKTANKDPIVLGKPGKDLGELFLRESGIEEPRRVLMIGDMLEQDISFGKKCGFQTLLVLSGGCSSQNLEENTRQDYSPEFYADSLADFIALINDLKKTPL